MYDKRGHKLNVKDVVVFTDSSSSLLIIGNVVKLTPSFVWIVSSEYPEWTFKRWYKRVVRIPDECK